ncbi:MAG: hypothetical protein GY805_36715 [Chloroflexi bacterium]|nr:hypothetical protein [Chloroflexota bacterium]
MGVLLGLFITAISEPYGGISRGLNMDFIFATFISGVVIGILHLTPKYGGTTFLQHYILRWLISYNQVLPFPFSDKMLTYLLDSFIERVFLRRVGCGWVFIHRTLLEYFAALHPDAQPPAGFTLNDNPDTTLREV